jgi:hypothetical protein
MDMLKTGSRNFNVFFMSVFNDGVCLCSVTLSFKRKVYICFLTRIFTSPTERLRAVVFAWPPSSVLFSQRHLRLHMWGTVARIITTRKWHNRPACMARFFVLNLFFFLSF